MKKSLCLLLLAAAGCTYPAYTVRRPLPTEPPVSREEIERMSNAGISEPVMIELIEKRGALALSTDDLVALKKADAPDPVVQKAIASERKIVERVIVEDYYSGYYYPGYYPYYGASFSYGFGWGYPYYGYGYGYGYPRGAMGVRVYR
jgi:hypothetical protein